MHHGKRRESSIEGEGHETEAMEKMKQLEEELKAFGLEVRQLKEEV